MNRIGTSLGWLFIVIFLIFADALVGHMFTDRKPNAALETQIYNIQSNMKKMAEQLADINEQQLFPNYNNLVLQVMNTHLSRCNAWCGRRRVTKFNMDAKATVTCECGR